MRAERDTTPVLHGGMVYHDTGAVAVDGPDWQAWLASNDLFYVPLSSGAGGATFRAETKQRGGRYWSAYRRIAGKLKKRYAGKSERLTADRIQDVARALEGDGNN